MEILIEYFLCVFSSSILYKKYPITFSLCNWTYLFYFDFVAIFPAICTANTALRPCVFTAHHPTLYNHPHVSNLLSNEERNSKVALSDCDYMKFKQWIGTSIENTHACKWIPDNFYRINTYLSIPGKVSEIHFYVFLVSNPGEKVLRSIKSRGPICPILLKRNMTFPHGLENNNASNWIFVSFPGMLIYVLFLKSCQKSICMHGCSPIHVVRIWECNLSKNHK